MSDYEFHKGLLKKVDLSKYDNDKELRALVAEYINLKNLKYKKSFKKVTWKHCIPMIESNDLEKKFLKIENYLIHIFNKIFILFKTLQVYCYNEIFSFAHPHT